MMRDNAQKELSVDGIARYLPADFKLEKIQVYEVIGSTNTEAKRQAVKGASYGTILVANAQTAGRGRVGRNFYSPRDGGVYFSIILRPALLRETTVLMTVAASVAVADAIEAVCGVYPKIKWVNDLYYQEKKVCGILAELVSNPHTGTPDAVVIGVGINCNAEFPEELMEIAGNIPPVEDAKNRLAAELSLRLSKLEEMISCGKFLPKYRENSMVLGKWITLLQEPGSLYYVRGIGERGELMIEDKNGMVRSLTTGEISIRLATAD